MGYLDANIYKALLRFYEFMIPEEKLQEIRDALEKSENPVVFFDDDPDGLVSYLLLKRKYEQCYGVPLKVSMQDESLFHAVIGNKNPDLVVILDRAEVSQELIDAINVPIIWLDHHLPQERQGVRYYNPRSFDPKNNKPTSYWAYKVVKQDLWLALVGIFADWCIPEFANEAEFPELIGGQTTPDGVLYGGTGYGELVKVISYTLMGDTSKIKKNIARWERMEGPYDILDQKTEDGKVLWENYKDYSKSYEELLEKGKAAATDDKILVFIYVSEKQSYTGGLSNELLYNFKDKVILVARSKEGTYRMSLRTGSDGPILNQGVLEKALDGIEGFGGGHEHACGASVPIEDFDKFIEQLKKAIED